MRLRSHRRNVVAVRSASVGAAARYGSSRLTRLARTRRIRRWIRTGGLLAVMGLMRIARSVRPRWRSLLAGGVLTAVGIMLRSGAGGMVLLPGLLLLLSTPLMPANPEAAPRQRSELERELAAYSTLGQRRDLEATLDRYPDGITYELRDILASQAIAANNNRFPAIGRY
jgi:hypothetical protein